MLWCALAAMSVRRGREGGELRARAWGCAWGIVFTTVARSADSLRASFRRVSGELSMTFWGWSLSATISGSVVAFEVASGACACSSSFSVLQIIGLL